MLTSSSTLAVLAAATLVAHANAHSNMILPLPTWSVGWSTNSFAATIEGDKYLPVPSGMSYSTDPADNTEAYWTAFNKSTYTSLKNLVDKTAEVQTLSPFGTATLECGFSLANGTARDLPSEYVEWNQLTEGHDGPCEVWCDDVLAFEDDNCAVDYPDTPSKWPYDVSKCQGASRLTAYWIALHGLPWQVYINCVPLTGSVNSTSATGTTTTTTTTAPAATTATPTATTATTTTSSPTATTATPTATTATTSDASTAAEADDSDCGSLDVAGSDESDCGSLDVAGSDDSDCGSLDVAGSDTDESTSTSTTPTSPGTSTSTGILTSTGTSTGTSSTGTSTSTPTSTTTTSSVAGESDSDEVAGDADTASYIEDSECGSLDVAGDDSECGSLDVAEDDSECGSLDMAESTYSGSTAGIDFSTFQGGNNAGTVSPQT